MALSFKYASIAKIPTILTIVTHTIDVIVIESLIYVTPSVVGLTVTTSMGEIKSWRVTN
ncbi:hypothetical protein CLOSBL3_12971 [Clostridiaceae bacterium BL-3]|nr:hypothetical protein CLOSBL3_12971 [Clostridiaceae bacterium BL-3]